MNPPNRTILHLDLDSFFVAVERLKDSSLKGKPVIIGGNSNRGVVSSASYEARAFGVKSAMPIHRAKKLCPQAIIIGGGMEEYARQSSIVTEIIRDNAPIVEKASIDEFYLDLTGMDRFFGCYTWSTELRQRIIKESGLPISFGLASNKLVAKIATGESKPNGQLQVIKGVERFFLAPLSIYKIPMIGKKTGEILENMGISTIEKLQQQQPDFLRANLGNQGMRLWKKAQGEDDSPVLPYREQKSISKETTFEKDIHDHSQLESTLISLIENLGFQLRKSEKLTSCITLKIRYANFETHSMQCRIPQASADHILISKAKELFMKLYRHRSPIRLIGVRISNLTNEEGAQVNLFESPHTRIDLYKAMDTIRIKHGKDAIRRAI